MRKNNLIIYFHITLSFPGEAKPEQDRTGLRRHLKDFSFALWTHVQSRLDVAFCLSSAAHRHKAEPRQSMLSSKKVPKFHTELLSFILT